MQIVFNYRREFTIVERISYNTHSWFYNCLETNKSWCLSSRLHSVIVDYQLTGLSQTTGLQAVLIKLNLKKRIKLTGSAAPQFAVLYKRVLYD
jgi:hypothetical protein